MTRPLTGEINKLLVNDKKEIRNESMTHQYFPLWLQVKPGGIMAGHDYSRHAPGVVNSVVEFSQKHNLNIISKTKEIWQIVKPN